MSAADVLKVEKEEKIQNVKLLIVGDVNGQFDDVFKKVATLNASKRCFNVWLRERFDADVVVTSVHFLVDRLICCCVWVISLRNQRVCIWPIHRQRSRISS